MKKTIHRKPAEGYLHRGVDVVPILTRIPPELKEEAELAADKLGTSLNRFIESSLRWYLDALKKEGSI